MARKGRARIFLSLMLFVSFLFSFPLAARAAEGDTGTTADGFSWEEFSDGTLAVTGYSGSATELTIPGTIDGKAVTSVGVLTTSGAFSGAPFTSVYNHNGEKRINGEAYSKCTSLKDVSLPDSLLYIDFAAFAGCTSLTDITLPANLLSIGESAFERTQLVSVIIPDKANYIGPEAFAGCPKLTKFTILNNETQFDEQTDFPHYDGKVFTGSPLTDGIYGNNGSTAKAYALSHNIKFCLLSTDGTINDAATGVAVSGFLPNGATLAVSQVSADSDTYKQAKQSIGDDKLLLLFDLSLLQGDEKVQPNGDVVVSIAIPDEYKNAENLVVAYIDNAGNVTYLDSTVKDGKISFTTNHFSAYAIIQRTVERVVESPKTGDNQGDEAFWAGVLLVLTAGGILTGRKLAKKER